MTDEKAPLSAAEWFEQGRACFHNADGLGTVAAMERVTALDSVYRHTDGDTPYFYLGKIHEIENRMDMAIFHYTRALAINGLDEESLIGRGSCYTVTKQHEQAISDFTRVLNFPEANRRSPLKHLQYALAENYRQLKDWHNALYWGEQALAADPDNDRHQKLVQQVTDEIHKIMV